MRSARQIAAEALLRVERGDYSQLVLDAALRDSGLDGRDRQFAAALFYGTLERRVTLDHCIARYARRPLGDTVAVLLREAFYQLLYLEGVPDHAVVDEAVELTRRMRVASASGLVNGVLRSFLRDGKRLPPVRGGPAARLAVEGSCCEDLADCLIGWFGPETAREILAASFGRPPVYGRVNPLKTDEPSLIGRLAEEGCAARPTALPGCVELAGAPAHTAAHAQGLFHIQDLCSQRAALALGAKPGERVLDLCAAPGSKSFLIAQEMKNTGAVLACDVSEGRLRQVEKGARRLGLTNISVLPNDARENAPPGVFDRVLCDVPCSGLGVLRRKPEIKLRGRETFSSLPETQAKILRTGARCLRPGGVLVYSTCTLNPQENDGVVDRFLEENEDFSPMPFENGEWKITFLPGDDGDGFFISRVRRTE